MLNFYIDIDFGRRRLRHRPVSDYLDHNGRVRSNTGCKPCSDELGATLEAGG